MPRYLCTNTPEGCEPSTSYGSAGSGVVMRHTKTLVRGRGLGAAGVETRHIKQHIQTHPHSVLCVGIVWALSGTKWSLSTPLSILPAHVCPRFRRVSEAFENVSGAATFRRSGKRPVICRKRLRMKFLPPLRLRVFALGLKDDDIATRWMDGFAG